MGKKFISNTFTVNTIEDGMSQQQIFTRNANAALPPRSQSDTPTLPSGWTYTPQGVDNTHPDEYVSMRSKDSSGVWSDYSPKVPYSHYGEDGTSLRIVGYANWLFGRNANGDPKPAASDIVLGDVDLLEYSSFASYDHIDVCEEISAGVYSWEAYAVELGTCYIFSGNNHIYEATESGWLDLGNIKGPKGDDAVNYDIVFSEAWAKVDNSGVISARLKGIAYKITGSNRVPQAGVKIRYGYILNDSGTYVHTTALSDGSFDTGSWFNGDRIEGAAKNSQNIFAAIIIDNTVMCTKYVTIGNQGATGAQGKIGRFFYYSGFDWDANNDTDVFDVTDAQVPFFSKAGSSSNKYYVFNPETTPSSGEMTMAQMAAATTSGGDINWNSKPWEVMTDDLKYLITEAVFGNYAHFGGAIINGDWEMSVYGVLYDASNNATNISSDEAYVIIDGVRYDHNNAYTKFDPTSPNKEKAGVINFVPNYSVDLKRGWSYQNVAEVNGVFRSQRSSDGSSTYLGAASLLFGYRNADIFRISCEGSGTYRNVKMQIGAGESGMTYFDIESRGTFQGNVTSMITLHNAESGTNVPSIVIHKGGIAMTNSDGSVVYKQKTWDELLS